MAYALTISAKDSTMNKRHILITGITRGLGKTLTELFLERGHAVAGCGRSSDALSALKNAHPQKDFYTAEVDLADDNCYGDFWFTFGSKSASAGA